MNGGLDAQCQPAAAVMLAILGGGEVHVDLVDAAILDHRREARNHGLESA